MRLIGVLTGLAFQNARFFRLFSEKLRSQVEVFLTVKSLILCVDNLVRHLGLAPQLALC